MREWKPRTRTEKQSTYEIDKKQEYARTHPPTRLDDPSPETLRECIKDGFCWWCGRNGFKWLSGHTSKAHGITANDLRDMAGLFKHQPTCNSELSERFRSRNLTDPRYIKQAKELKRVKGYKMSFSKAGRCYQDGVKTPAFKAIRAKGQEEMARMRQNGRHFGKPCKPHKCPGCGKLLPTAHPITCSPECRKIVRQKTALRSLETRQKIAKVNPEYMASIKNKISLSMRQRYRQNDYQKGSFLPEKVAI